MRTVTVRVDLEQEKYDRLVKVAARGGYATVDELLTELTDLAVAGALKGLAALEAADRAKN